MKRPALLAAFAVFLAGALSLSSSTWASAWMVRPDPAVVYRLSNNSFGLGLEEDDTLLVMRVGAKDHSVFWAAERRLRRTQFRTTVQQHAFIDGRACPALEAAFAKLADLPPVRFGTPQNHDEITMVMDGGELVLSGPGEGHAGDLPPPLRGDIGRLVRVADHGGPLLGWWRSAEQSIEPCWRDDPKLRDGTVLKVRLATDEEAKQQKP